MGHANTKLTVGTQAPMALLKEQISRYFKLNEREKMVLPYLLGSGCCDHEFGLCLSCRARPAGLARHQSPRACCVHFGDYSMTNGSNGRAAVFVRVRMQAGISPWG